MALKLRTVKYARAHAYREIRTNNDSRNRPMLRINEAMGFVKEPAWITFEKRLGGLAGGLPAISPPHPVREAGDSAKANRILRDAPIPRTTEGTPRYLAKTETAQPWRLARA